MSRSLEELERDSFLAEAETLAQLTQHPGWARYDALLTNMWLSALQHMAQAPIAEIPYWQGVVAAMNEIKERPHQIVAAGRTVQEDEAYMRSERQALDFADGVSLEDDL